MAAAAAADPRGRAGQGRGDLSSTSAEAVDRSRRSSRPRRWRSCRPRARASSPGSSATCGSSRRPIPRTNPAAAIAAILKGGYPDTVRLKYERPDNRIADIEQFALLAARYDSLDRLIADLILAGDVYGMDSVEPTSRSEVLVLSTIHQAKGLEWSHVFVPRLIEEGFPHRRALDEPGGEEEERRIFYVAISRAMNELTLDLSAVHPPRTQARPSSPRPAGSSRRSTSRSSSAVRSSRTPRPGPWIPGRAMRDVPRIEPTPAIDSGRGRSSGGLVHDGSSRMGTRAGSRRRAATLTARAADVPVPRPRLFRIQVVDEQTGRGVPLVELRTVNQVRYVTDSNGIAAFDEPGLFDTKVFFTVTSHGYEAAKDNFGLPRRRAPGHRGRLGADQGPAPEHRRAALPRHGRGIYRDSILTGDRVPIREPLLNGRVMGQDSVVERRLPGEDLLVLGRYQPPGLPLGNFHVPGATSELPGQGGLDPRGRRPELLPRRQGLRAADCALARRRADLDLGPGRPARPRGLGPDVRQLCQGPQHAAGLPARARRVPPGDASVREGRRVPDAARYPGDYPSGHAFLYRDRGVDYVYYATPYPLVRVPADPERLRDPLAFESFTCLKAGTKRSQQQLDRGADGALHYGWKRHTQVLPQDQQDRLIAAGRLEPTEALLDLRDVETGKIVLAHGGSVYWNALPRPLGDDRRSSRPAARLTSARSGTPRPTRRRARGSTPAKS